MVSPAFVRRLWALRGSGRNCDLPGCARHQRDGSALSSRPTSTCDLSLVAHNVCVCLRVVARRRVAGLKRWINLLRTLPACRLFSRARDAAGVLVSNATAVPDSEDCLFLNVWRPVRAKAGGQQRDSSSSRQSRTAQRSRTQTGAGRERKRQIESIRGQEAAVDRQDSRTVRSTLVSGVLWARVEWPFAIASRWHHPGCRPLPTARAPLPTGSLSSYSFTAVSRGTKEMMQPCLVYRQAISLVAHNECVSSCPCTAVSRGTKETINLLRALPSH